MSARADPRGGRSAMVVPTATAICRQEGWSAAFQSTKLWSSIGGESMRRAGLIAVVIAVILFAVLFGYPRLFAHRIELTVYFQNANGLRAGAPVRLAGVEVGKVTSVR